MKKMVIIILFVLVLCGCSQTNDKSENKDLYRLMENNNYVIIDVRTKEEYNEEHLVDAINIPYDEIDDSIEIDKNNIIFVYCRSGKRSSIAYKTLTQLGYEVYDLGAFSDINLPRE